MSDQEWERLQMFKREFKALVRKYSPQYPTTDEQAEFLAFMQDGTSCYSPWIWSDEDKKEKQPAISNTRAKELELAKFVKERFNPKQPY